MKLVLIDAPTIFVPWFEEGFQLAQRCLVRGSFSYVSGAPGTGKTRLGEFIHQSWKDKKLPGTVHLLSCRETKIERIARDAFRVITGKALQTRPTLSPYEISNLILDHLATQKAALLYIDGIQKFDRDCHGYFLDLLNAAQDRKLPVGMVFATYNSPFTLFDVEQSPNYAGSLLIPRLRPHEIIDVYAEWIPEFVPIKKAFYKKEIAAREIAEFLDLETKGNFQRLVSLWQLAEDRGLRNLLCPNRLSTLVGRQKGDELKLVA